MKIYLDPYVQRIEDIYNIIMAENSVDVEMKTIRAELMALGDSWTPEDVARMYKEVWRTDQLTTNMPHCDLCRETISGRFTVFVDSDGYEMRGCYSCVQEAFERMTTMQPTPDTKRRGWEKK